MINLPNTITSVRVVLAFIAVGLLYTNSVTAKIFSIFLTLIALTLDWLDGWMARTYNQATTAGSLIDIAGDRIVENTYWIVFAQLNLIQVWIPLFFVARGFVVDTIRALAFKKGKTPFGERTFHELMWTRFLTSSKFMRGSINTLKILSFTGLIGISMLNEPKTNGFYWLQPVVMSLVALTLFVCILRTIPIFVDAKKILTQTDFSEKK